jgi:hypothetical protein
MDIGVSRTSILVIIVAGALLSSLATMNLQQAFGINRSTQKTFQDSSACDAGSTCNNTALETINYVRSSDNNVASEDIFGLNVCLFGNPTCSNDASQVIVINGDGNRATLRTHQQNFCFETSVCTNDYDTSIGISGNNNQMDGLVDQHNRCRLSSTCTNEGSFVSDLPAGNSGSLNMIDNQNNVCSNSSKCTNDSNNNPGSSSQRNVCDSGSTCANSGVNNVNQCVNGTVCTNSGDAPVGSINLNKCVDGAVCTNSGQNTNVRAIGATSCSSGALGTTTTCLPGQLPIVRP